MNILTQLLAITTTHDERPGPSACPPACLAPGPAATWRAPHGSTPASRHTPPHPPPQAPAVAEPPGPAAAKPRRRQCRARHRHHHHHLHRCLQPSALRCPRAAAAAAAAAGAAVRQGIHVGEGGVVAARAAAVGVEVRVGSGGKGGVGRGAGAHMEQVRASVVGQGGVEVAAEGAAGGACACVRACVRKDCSIRSQRPEELLLRLEWAVGEGRGGGGGGGGRQGMRVSCSVQQHTQQSTPQLPFMVRGTVLHDSHAASCAKRLTPSPTHTSLPGMGHLRV
eukprot:1159467-Pelagomonas_calceolata.AAC.14